MLKRYCRRIIAIILVAACIFTLAPGFGTLGGSYYAEAETASSKTGFAKNSEGKWVFIRNGKPDYSYTGLAKSIYTEEIYFATKGRFDPKYTGIYKFQGTYYAVIKGKVDKTFTGVVPNEKGGWFFTRKGVYDQSYTGLAKQANSNIVRYVKKGVFCKYTGIYKFNGTYYAVRDGIVDMKFTGAIANEKGSWHFTSKGVYDTSYTGLAKQVNSSNIRYVKSGVFKKYTGIHKFQGTFYSVIDGLVNKNFTGVIKNESGVWCFVRKGVYDKEYVGLAKQYNSENILYVKNGKWDNTYNGIYKYNDVFYAVVKGKVDRTFTGLIKNEKGVWHYAKKGIYDTTYTGLARKLNEASNKLYYVSGGKLAKHTGLVKFEGKHYAVIDGEIDYSFTGIIQNKSNGNWHYAKNGIYNTTYKGLARRIDNKELYYVADGKPVSHTGLVKFEGTHYAVKDGRIDYNFTGIIQNKNNGNWHYVKNGIYDNTYTGPSHSVSNAKKWFHVRAGAWNDSFTGDYSSSDNEYYVKDGVISRSILVNNGKKQYIGSEGTVEQGIVTTTKDDTYYSMENNQIRTDEGKFSYQGNSYYSQKGGKLVKNTYVYYAGDNFYAGENGALKKLNKVLYLTFDDGPGYYTDRLLDILKSHGAKATFFVNGNNGASSYYRDCIGRAYREGHAIGNHTYSHNWSSCYSSTSGFWSEFDRNNEIIYEQTGTTTNLLRFPGGSSNLISANYSYGIMSRLVAQCEDRGVVYFDWNVDSGDAGGTTSSYGVYSNIVNGISRQGSGAVILCHDIKGYTVDAIDDVLRWGKNNGYVFLPLTVNSPTAHHGVNN